LTSSPRSFAPPGKTKRTPIKSRENIKQNNIKKEDAVASTQQSEASTAQHAELAKSFAGTNANTDATYHTHYHTPTSHNAGNFSSSFKTLSTVEAKIQDELNKENPNVKLLELFMANATIMREQLARVQPSNSDPRSSSAPPPTDHAATEKQTLLDEIKTLQQGGKSVPVPTLTVKQGTIDWAGTKKSRTTWPFKNTPTFQVEGFRTYMLTIKQVLPDTFEESHQMGLDYLFQLVDIGVDNYSHVGAVQALHDQGIIEKLLSLPILDPCFSWTMKIFAALHHLVAFMLIQCEKESYGPPRRSLNLLLETHIKARKKACRVYRKEAKQTRKDLDDLRLTNYMTAEEAQLTLSESMLDLVSAKTASEGQSTITPFVQRVVSINMAWQFVIPGTFARSGELEQLTEEEVKTSRAAGKKLVTIEKHKTRKTRGKLGRHLTDAMWEASDVNESMPPLEGSTFTDDKRPFIRPNQPHKRTSCLYGLLKNDDGVYCPTKTFPRTNLNRKRISTVVRSDAGQDMCKAWIADFNAHLVETAEDNYVLSRVEEQALKGKTMSKAFYGEFVPWPTAAMIPSETAEEAYNRLYEKYGRHDDAVEESSSDHCSDSDADDADDTVGAAVDPIISLPAIATPSKRRVRGPRHTVTKTKAKKDLTPQVPTGPIDKWVRKVPFAGALNHDPEPDASDEDRRVIVREEQPKEEEKAAARVEKAVAEAEQGSDDGDTQPIAELIPQPIGRRSLARQLTDSSDRPSPRRTPVMVDDPERMLMGLLDHAIDAEEAGVPTERTKHKKEKRDKKEKKVKKHHKKEKRDKKKDTKKDKHDDKHTGDTATDMAGIITPTCG